MVTKSSDTIEQEQDKEGQNIRRAEMANDGAKADDENAGNKTNNHEETSLDKHVNDRHWG